MALVFKRDKFLLKSALQVDCLYLWKDGHVRLYLGNTSGGQMVFYSLGILDLRSRHWDEIYILHESVALNALIQQVRTLLSGIALDEDAIEWYSSLPSIYACLEKDICKQFSPYPDVASFCQAYKSVLGVIKAPKEIAKGSVYVSAKDLVVGGVYHTGEDCWRHTYCFMGRNNNTGEFIWMFIGNDEAFRKDPYDFYVRYHPPIEYQKSNKRVRPVTPEKNAVLGNFNAVKFSSAFDMVCAQHRLRSRSHL